MPKKKQNGPTIADVARESGVGSMTVSRVLNGGKYVKAHTAEKVRRAIAKLEYRPNEAARILRGQSTRTIGLVIPNLADPFFSACAHAVQQVAAMRDYVTLLLACESDVEEEDQTLALLKSRNISGLLICPSRMDSPRLLQELQDRGVPVVTIDRTVPGLNANEVMVENAEGTQKAVDHLIEHGHRRILCVGYDSQFNSISQRMDGYRKAMANAGLKPQILVVENEADVPRALLKKLRGPNPPTALFTMNNVTTTQALQLLQRENIEVPQQLAIAGFDDFDLATLLAVPLTAVRQPAAEIGRSGTRILLDSIQSDVPMHQRAHSRIVLPTELVVRRSCGCEAPPKIVPLSEQLALAR
jgi:LacI family transcriptional regulator